MAKRESVFGDEWRRCLREHYKYVVRQDDKDTEETLVPILDGFGFREDELKRLKLEATMHVDDVADDYVPDMELLAENSIEQTTEETTNDAPESTFATHPNECQCAACMDVVLEAGHDEEGQPIAEEERDEPPKQRSLF